MSVRSFFAAPDASITGTDDKKRFCVRMQRIPEQLLRRALFKQISEIHHADAVGDIPDDADIVRDEQIGQIFLLLQIQQQIDDLRLDGDIKRGDRLIADDKFRVQDQRAGNSDPLALTTGEFVRVAVVMLRLQADLFNDIQRHIHPVGAVPHVLDGQHLCQNLADIFSGIQRGIGVLKDHLQLRPVLPERLLMDFW